MDIFSPKGVHGLIREVNEKNGVKNGAKIICETIKSKKIPVHEFSISELWETYVGTSRHDDNKQMSIREAIEPTAFPTIMRSLISTQLIDGYNEIDKVSDKLVTPFNSNLEIDTIAGFKGTERPTKLLPGEKYPKTSFEEKYVQVGYEKKGQEIDVTEEAVKFDQTGKILMAAQDIGRATAEDEERFIMRKIMDIDANVYKPSGSATQLYAAGFNNLKTSNALADDTDLTAAYIQFLTLCKADDKNTRPISLPKDLVVLVPGALMFLLGKILDSVGNSASGNLGDNQFGEKARKKFGLNVTPLVSVYLDEVSSSTWFMGNFKKQFVKKIVFPFSMQDLPGDPHSDILITYKSRYACDVAAKDTRYVVKCTA